MAQGIYYYPKIDTKWGSGVVPPSIEDIANVLYKSKILESWGRGIGTMVDECKRVGLPAPEFNTDGNFVWVVFKYNRNSVVVTPQLPHS